LSRDNGWLQLTELDMTSLEIYRKDHLEGEEVEELND
jgi:hypothetical protein